MGVYDVQEMAALVPRLQQPEIGLWKEEEVEEFAFLMELLILDLYED